MADTPCGKDTALEDIKAAQDELNSLMEGGKDVLSAINDKATEIASKLNDFKPEVTESPNLQKELTKLSGADPVTAGSIAADIQKTFGKFVDNLGELLDEVSPGLGEASAKVSENPFDLSALGDLLSATNISTEEICAKAKNVEIQTLPDGTQKSVEKPNAPEIPQKIPDPEPVKEVQNIVTQAPVLAIKQAMSSAWSYAAEQLWFYEKEKPQPPEISDLQWKKNGNRYFSNYTFLYLKCAQTLGLSDDDPSQWPYRLDPWVELKYARDTKYIGEPLLDENIAFNDVKEYYGTQSVSADYPFEEALKIWIESLPEEGTSFFIGSTRDTFFKEV